MSCWCLVAESGRFTLLTHFSIYPCQRETLLKLHTNTRGKYTNVTKGNRSVDLNKELMVKAEYWTGRQTWAALVRITQNSKLESLSLWPFHEHKCLVLLVEEWLREGPMWRGSLEDKGCIEARDKGYMIQACECTAPKLSLLRFPPQSFHFAVAHPTPSSSCTQMHIPPQPLTLLCLP